MNPELDRKLRHLRLSGIANALEARNQEAVHHHLAYPEFLELLVEDELARRRDRLFARRSESASPGVNPAMAIADLNTCSWKSITPCVSSRIGFSPGCR